MKTYRRHLWTLVLSLLLPFFLAAQSNQYLHFDKIDDFVQLPNASQYVTNAAGLTMTGWFYCDQLAYGQGMMGLRGASQGFYMIILNNGSIECRYISSAGFHEYVAPNNTIIPQIWQHFAFVFDGSTIKLYQNGILKGSSAASGAITNPAISFAIGKSILAGFNFVYGGRIDEITLWNKALTQVEVQDMIDNELAGTEPDLQLYYKFNQGVPGGDNTSITDLVCEIGSGTRDADLMNFALIGDSSNFGGTLNPGFQAISFPQIANKLVSDPPFYITASATSGLPVSFQIMTGPATITDSLITLTGDSGQVLVKATQPGGGPYSPAVPVINSFHVLNPATHLPDIEVRSPLPGQVIVPTLRPIQLAAISTIEFPELFSVQGVSFTIDGNTIPAYDHGNGHYTAWWTPPAYGPYTILINATNNFNHTATLPVSITITPDTADMDVTAVQGVWLNSGLITETVEADLPSYVGAFNQIIGTLEVSCPTGGCGEWDRVASVEAKGHDGVWHEIIRYITPFGTACTHNIDLTDYMSLLQGRIAFRLNCATLDNGYIYDFTLHYKAGFPNHCYSSVFNIWNDDYPFGDYANLQPVQTCNFSYPDNTVASTLKLVSTGHGWGDLNTYNAAEFYEATHHIWVNNQETFEQHNWKICNPNPDGCQPQNGTWYHPRAGWCPGSIAPWFDYNMTPYISTSAVELKYVFYPDYLDLCHPNNPNCVTGVTCDDCSDGFNPFLAVACNLVCFADSPILEGIHDDYSVTNANISIYPNPSSGIITIKDMKPGLSTSYQVQILTPGGRVVKAFLWDGQEKELDFSNLSKGMYFFKVLSYKGMGIKKFILQ